MGVFWEFVIFTIPISPKGTPLAMFTGRFTTVIKTRGLLTFEKIFLAHHFRLFCKKKIIHNSISIGCII